MMFTVVVHFATALATLVIYRSEVARITGGLMQRKNNEEFQFSMKILLSMIPAAAIGVIFADELELLFDKQIILVGVMLWVTGILLMVADRAKNTVKDVTFGHSIIIGIAQAIAILPGISRSGATISTSVLLGVDRNKAASFSFLVVVPLILGKIAKDLIDGGSQKPVEKVKESASTKTLSTEKTKSNLVKRIRCTQTRTKVCLAMSMLVMVVCLSCAYFDVDVQIPVGNVQRESIWMAAPVMVVIGVASTILCKKFLPRALKTN